MKKWIIAIVALQLVGVAGTAQAQKKSTWKVKETKVACTPGGEKDCLMVKQGCLKGWDTYTGKIDKFNFQEGTRYKIKVVEQPTANTAQLVNVMSTKNIFTVPVTAAVSTMDMTVLEQKIQIVKVNGKSVIAKKAHFSFNSKEGRAFGNGGCNGFHGEASVSGQTITFKNFMSTMMACEPEISKQEAEIVNALSNKTLTVVQKDNHISFVDVGKELLVMKLRSEDELKKDLSSGFWQLISLRNVGKNYDEMGIRFDFETNKISGFGGCNGFGGNFILSGTTLKTEEMITTMKGCLNEETQKDEQTFYNLMNKATLTVDQIGDLLYLLIDGKTAAVFNKQN